MIGIEGKNAFLSGPMTGLPKWNKEAFAKAEERLYVLGAEWVFNPATDAPKTDFDPYGHDYWMACTLHELTTLPHHRADSGFSPVYDVLVLLPGWEASEGARTERMVAEAIGIEIAELSEVMR
ncbi:MAG: DUF4406 domain-containing protein [Atopobiaceae bacterium]|nr:DUF4406 domain-containing protein [Atopobiaceae bacterium]